MFSFQSLHTYDGVSENQTKTSEGKFRLQIMLMMATCNLSFNHALNSASSTTHPKDLKTEWENETPPGLGLWTIKCLQQLWTGPPPPRLSGLLPSVFAQTALAASGSFRPVINTPALDGEFMLLLPHSQIWPLCSIPEASSESAKPTVTNSSRARISLLKVSFQWVVALRCLNHFPRSRVTQRRNTKSSHTPPKEHRRTSYAQIRSTL